MISSRRTCPERVWKSSAVAFTCALALLVATDSGARPPADVQKLEDASAAMADDDCAHAVEILGTVTPARKSSTRWLEAAARANECAGQLTAAAELYRHLDRRLPADPERTRRIADLEDGRSTSTAAPDEPQPASLAETAAWDTQPQPQAAPVVDDPEPVTIQGRWSTSGQPPDEGYFGESYLRRLKLEIDGSRARFRGQIYVEPELGIDRYQEGSVHWYEAQATGLAASERVDLNGVCIPKVWSDEQGGVVPGEEMPFSGSFVYVGDRETLSYEGDQAIDLPCGIDFGLIHRSSASPIR